MAKVAIQAGHTYKVTCGGLDAWHIIHVRAVVDDLFVIREWHKHKQRWAYEIIGQYWFDTRQVKDCGNGKA